MVSPITPSSIVNQDMVSHNPNIRHSHRHTGRLHISHNLSIRSISNRRNTHSNTHNKASRAINHSQ